jgi:phenylacetate-coenzyme A ligase PaaK-like adenylate-forming protein
MSFENQIFSINSAADFNRIALETFQYQVENCAVYNQFCKSILKKTPSNIEDIPFLPISFFKTHEIRTNSNKEAEHIFYSSGTTGENRSKHLILNTYIYEESFLKTYRDNIGNPEEQVILALLPNYLEQGNSSLVYMVDTLIKHTKSELSGFLLNNLDTIEKKYLQALSSGKKVVIFGVSYALLDLAEKKMNLSEAFIIETGGMKGRRKELSKEELHALLIVGLNVPFISSEYGMTELLSQAYSNKDGLFKTPAWMKILIRDLNDPLSYLENGKTGGINIIDLANLYSCSFISSQDLGKIEQDSFRIMGRFDNSDIRGCNLMIE